MVLFIPLSIIIGNFKGNFGNLFISTSHISYSAEFKQIFSTSSKNTQIYNIYWFVLTVVPFTSESMTGWFAVLFSFYGCFVNFLQN